jgi:hypothetical protein
MLLNNLLILQSVQHVSGTYMPIIRSSRLYLCYSMWCVVPWVLVVGGQVQDGRLCVRDEGCCMVCSALVAGSRRTGAGRQAMRPG